MAWVNDRFYYSIGILKRIAENYIHLYHDASWKSLFALVEFKADFDRALDSIGKGKWTGKVEDFRKYKYFGKKQQVVIADILGMRDYELENWGISEARKLRHKAYKSMVKVLNKKI